MRACVCVCERERRRRGVGVGVERKRRSCTRQKSEDTQEEFVCLRNKAQLCERERAMLSAPQGFSFLCMAWDRSELDHDAV